MFDDLIGAYGSRFLLAAGGVGIALLLLVVVLLIIRSRAPSPFVRGGRNRQPRLQVLDAAAVDARRRLVLVRAGRRRAPGDDRRADRYSDRKQNFAARRIGTGACERVPAAEQTEQPVMIAEAEPVAPPAPKPVMARSLASVEEYVPEPAPVRLPPVPAPRHPAEAAAVEAERSPRPAPSPAPTIRAASAGRPCLALNRPHRGVGRRRNSRFGPPAGSQSQRSSLSCSTRPPGIRPRSSPPRRRQAIPQDAPAVLPHHSRAISSAFLKKR